MADTTQKVKNLSKELDAYVSNLDLKYCKNLLKAIDYKFKVLKHEGIKVVDWNTNYFQTYTDISNMLDKAMNGNFGIQFWEHNNFNYLTVENCIIEIINRQIITKQEKQNDN